MTIAEILEKNKIDRMAEIERFGGLWRDGCFHFPDGSCGSFSRTEAYRDANGELRLRTVFVVEEKTAGVWRATYYDQSPISGE